MNTLNLTIPLTIPQLAEMLRAQFSAEERQELAALMQLPSSEDESVATSLRIAIKELNQYKRGEIVLPTLEEFLNELQG